MMSVICVFNNRGVLGNYLLRGLNLQAAPYELVLMDNTRHGYHSAAQALNEGGRRAKGKYLLFTHQDVRMCGPEWLANAEKSLDQIENIGIAGVAGMSELGRSNRDRRRNVILEHESPVTKWGNPIPQPEFVQTVDECLAIVPRDVFAAHQFDEKACEGWHHYAVDYSLTAKSLGLNVIVLPLLVHHRSLGFSRTLTVRLESIEEIQRYYRSLERIVAKHRAHFEWIYTTNGDYKTSRNPFYQDLKRLPWIVISGFRRERGNV